MPQSSSVTAIRLSIAGLSKNAGSGAGCGGGCGAAGVSEGVADIDRQNSGCAARFKAAAILIRSVTTSRNAAAAARRIILSSALIGALSSFAMNAIVPALPQIQRHFAASIEATQLIVSGGFLALALGWRPTPSVPGLVLFAMYMLGFVLAPLVALAIVAVVVWPRNRAFTSNRTMS